MQHLLFWYFITTIAVGIVSATMAAMSYAKTRGTLQWAFIGLHASLSLLLLINAVFAYVRTNVGEADPILFRLLSYLDSPIAVDLVMVALPVFIHELFAVPEAASRNRVFALAVGALYAVYNLVLFIAPEGGALERLARYSLDHAAFLAVVAYCLVTGLVRYRRVADGELKPLCRRFLILLGLFLPVIVHDKLRLSSLHLLPLPYGCFCILFASHFAKIGFSPAGTPVDGEEAGELSRYHISKREKEIVDLVLEGCDYRTIAQRLSISVHTVKAHIRNIYPKFGVTNRYELMVLLRPTTRE